MDVSSGKILWDTLPLQRPAYREEVWYYSGVLVLDESDRARPRIQNEYTKFISNTTKQRRVCQWADSRFAAFGHRFHNHTYWF
jgi:hypothetical protein